MKHRDVKNYSSELLLSKELVEMIKDYYKSKGIPTYNMKIQINPEMDEYGSRLYTITSNIRFNVTKGVMELTDVNVAPNRSVELV